MVSSFSELGLSETTLNAILELGYEEPTAVQEQTIRLMLEGSDVIAQAQTGTGKTAAFALPIIQNLDPDIHTPQALILTPTRELAIQVAEAFQSYSKHQGISILAIYGGQPIERQLRALERGVQVVVGTPGRVMDHIRRKTLRLAPVRMVVLDEADEMLNMGFIEDIEIILKETAKDRQTALFSATMPAPIAALARRYMHDAKRVTSHPRQLFAIGRKGESRVTLGRVPRETYRANPASASPIPQCEHAALADGGEVPLVGRKRQVNEPLRLCDCVKQAASQHGGKLVNPDLPKTTEEHDTLTVGGKLDI